MASFVLGPSEYDLVARIVRRRPGVRSGMDELLDACGIVLPHPVWRELGKLDFERDTASLNAWLMQVLVVAPLHAQITGLYFGLAEVPSGAPEHTTCHLSMLGADRFDAADEDCRWAADCTYRPSGGTTDSTVLEAIYRLVQEAGQDVAAVGEYVLGLGYACLAVRDVCDSLRPQLLAGAVERGIAVGFDCGDTVLLGSLRLDSWQQHESTTRRRP